MAWAVARHIAIVAMIPHHCLKVLVIFQRNQVGLVKADVSCSTGVTRVSAV